MRSLECLLMVVLFAVSVEATTSAVAEAAHHDPAIFGLCSSNVARVALAKASPGATVHVQLTEEASAEFARLTKALQGKWLTVVAGREVFFSAVVQVPVESGLMTNPALPVAEAKRLSQEIMVSRPLSECGGSVRAKTPNQALEPTGGPAAQLSRYELNNSKGKAGITRLAKNLRLQND